MAGRVYHPYALRDSVRIRPVTGEDLEQPAEPLHLSAPIAWNLAPELCRADPATGGNCAWNHGFWQILRMMGLAGSAAHRGALYRRVIASTLAQRRPARILISGTADYAMLAQVLLAAHAAGESPSVTVVDVCETPLRLNRWYADYRKVGIETCCHDILHFDAPGRFDVICTDSLLGRFPPALWPALASRWMSLLKSGGRVVTANRLRPAQGPAREGFSAEQAAALREAVARKAQERGAAIPVGADALDRAAAAYAARHFTYPLRSADEIGRPFEETGFLIEELSVAAGVASTSSGAGGPSVPSASDYLHLVARRP